MLFIFSFNFNWISCVIFYFLRKFVFQDRNFKDTDGEWSWVLIRMWIESSLFWNQRATRIGWAVHLKYTQWKITLFSLNIDFRYHSLSIAIAFMHIKQIFF
jgi:hypothetical protein